MAAPKPPGDQPAAARIEGPSFLDNPPLRKLLDLLDRDGEEARVVGGAVRNHLMGLAVADVDIATTATPSEVMARAASLRLKCIPTGIDHGTVTVLVDGIPFEITTLRSDVETDGRRARVVFGRDFVADAMRRDFTMNALSVTRDGRVFDPAGGLADIERRRVRFIGDASTRIREDYLRILRFFRFHAAYGDGLPDGEAFAAIGRERAGLGNLSRERVRAELLKLLAAAGAARVLGSMASLGLVVPILGGVFTTMRLAGLLEIESLRAEKGPDAILRLAALAVLKAEDAERLRDRLRLSNDETTRLAMAARALSKLHGCSRPPAPGDLRTLLFLEGRRAACDALLLAQTQSGAAAADTAWVSAARFLADTPEPRQPFGGADLISRGLPPGKTVGKVLKKLQADWIRAGFPDAPHEISRLIAEAIESASRD